MKTQNYEKLAPLYIHCKYLFQSAPIGNCPRGRATESFFSNLILHYFDSMGEEKTMKQAWNKTFLFNTNVKFKFSFNNYNYELRQKHSQPKTSHLSHNVAMYKRLNGNLWLSQLINSPTECISGRHLLVLRDERTTAILYFKYLFIKGTSSLPSLPNLSVTHNNRN